MIICSIQSSRGAGKEQNIDYWNGCDDIRSLSKWQGENPIDERDDPIEEDSLVEVEAARTIWKRGGLSFDSSDEEEVTTKLVRRKIECKKRADLRLKLSHQGKKSPCIQGRTLATRKL
ncbi:hypothetical protein PIB30_088185, partial [Stylosanthes scabra]|nr:hypothetical protein [Stylosanthes scabra]